MTDLGAVPTSAAKPRWRRTPVLVSAGLVVVLVAAIGLYLVLRPKPLHYFGEHGNEQTMPTRVGRTVYLDTGIGDEHRVRIDSIEPALTGNSAHATVRILLCTPRPGVDPLGAGFAADMRTSYRSVRQFRPGDYVLGPFYPDGLAVMIAVTPTTKGVVSMDGFRIHYHSGDRTGSEQAGLDTVVRTATG